jgi:outer membrane protein assembly factor BamB
MNEDPAAGGQQRLVSLQADFDPERELRVSSVDNPVRDSTLGDVGVAVRLEGPERFPETVLTVPLDQQRLAGIEPASVRVFHVDEQEGSLAPLWTSGYNQGLGYLFAPVRRPGLYVAIGLPADPLLRELLKALARERRIAGPDADPELDTLAFLPLLDGPDEELEVLRATLAQTEREVRRDPLLWQRVRIGGDGAVAGYPLPEDEDLEAFRGRLRRRQPPPGGLPEEQLFFSPDLPYDPWPWPPEPRPLPPDLPALDFGWLWRLRLGDLLDLLFRRGFILCLLFGGRDWWMYQHDAQHTGRAGCSWIRACNAHTLSLRHKVALNGAIISQPVVVNGKVYVGTGDSTTTGVSGTFYRIGLTTGAIEAQFSFSGVGSRQTFGGVGSSPAVVGGRVYFSGLNGKLYCLDATTFAVLWVTDLRHTDLAHNQPVDHGSARATGWSSPLVVGGRVYVGFGEGEDNWPIGAFGFVYCLDAATGQVQWLFCTNQFVPGTDNQPNVIPPSSFAGTPPAPFTKAAADPPERGASPWSSAAYDRALGRIYIGTGNSRPVDDPLPDARYASGMISLDATTGQFRAFFQPSGSDNYRPNVDFDVDIPGGPTVFTRNGQRVVGIGAKGGSYFILDANTLAVLQRRQLLPHDAAGNPLPNVDPPQQEVDAGGNPIFRENKSGVFGTAAVHRGLERIFIPLGGYSGAIDHTTTPFMRALDWNTLNDAWVTAGTNPPRYTVPVPPMYTTPGEAGLSSAAVVNDVVFVSTTKPGLYALRADSGFCLWAAPGFGPGTYCLGPAVYGSHVVAGTGQHLYIYSL